MQRLSMMALLTAAVVAIAPAAWAQQGTMESMESKDQKATTQQHGNMGMTSKGPSVSFLVHHAYQEALHASESFAFNMKDMATNHLENVHLTLGMLDLEKDVRDSKLREHLRGILDKSKSVESNPTAQGTNQLVNQFVVLISAMPASQGGGGGHGMPLTPLMLLPGELVGMAASSAADTQVDVAHRDFAGAKLHAAHSVALLDAALKSAQLNNLGTNQLNTIRTLQKQAKTVLDQVNARSTQADESAGRLVTQIGLQLAALAPHPGGGAGHAQ